MPIPKPVTQLTEGADIDLSLILKGNQEVQLIAFDRDSAELITIEITYRIVGLVFHQIFETTSPIKSIFINDVLKLPEGTVFRILTTGASTGALRAAFITRDKLDGRG